MLSEMGLNLANVPGQILLRPEHFQELFVIGRLLHAAAKRHGSLIFAEFRGNIINDELLKTEEVSTE